MATTLLEIVSPDRLLLSQPVDMAVIPAAEGEMGVMPGHAPMIVLLQGGTITLHEGGRPTSRLYVSGGFAEITQERCTVLADEAIPVSEVSRRTADARLADADAAYAAADKTDIPALDAAMGRQQAARAMVAAVEAA
jgi:F-type H+-transporting ATPase subunit epsilon